MIPEAQVVVGEHRQAPGHFGLGFLLLAPANALTGKTEPGAQFFTLVELGVDALA